MLQATTSGVSASDPHLWKKDRYLAPITAIWDSIELLSLDIFDTLLFRACASPSDVFMKAAEKALRAKCLQSSITPSSFKEIRILAERKSRERQRALHGFGEVMLQQIYAELPPLLGDPIKLAQIEVEAEAETCYLNPHVASLLHACKERQVPVALLSDMYLSSDQIRYLLQSAGLDLANIDVLLVSSEEHDGKSSGRLFARLKESYPGIASGAILHIGDNVSADVEGAAREGIPSIHYNVIPENFESRYHWEYVRHGDVLPAWKSLRKLVEATDSIAGLGEREKPFYRFGASVLGPYLQSLCDWVVDTCVELGAHEVHPLMREAYLLAPMLEATARMRGVELQVKPVYVSRQGTYLASLQTFGATELDKLLGIRGVKVGEIFELLDISDEAGSFAAELEKRIDGELAERLRVFLLDERIRVKVLEAIERNRQLFIAYLKQEFGSPEKLITVDIGFNGTIQHALETIVRLAGYMPQMTHLLAVGSDKLNELSLNGMDIRCLLRSGGEGSELGRRIARSPAFVEELMMGEFGSTLRFERDVTGRVRPIMAGLLHAVEEFAFKRACQEGALAFQTYYAYLLSAKKGGLKRASEEPEAWSKPIHRVIEMPMPEEARMLGDLTHQDNFCTVYISPICEKVDDAWFAQGGDAFIDICNYGPSILNANWPQGMVTRQMPYYLYTYYLRQRDGFGSGSMLFEMIQHLKQDSIRSVNIYGTGSFAEHVMKTVWFHGLETAYWIDPQGVADASPWGKFEHSSLEQAVKQAGSHAYLLATLSDMESYRNKIESAYRDTEITPSLYEL
ncbi:HAD family hydrolase [Paenibacillus sp. GCM10027628]|uniref:HAD family hydrolase n=1 Tax=Paenibacillus sp. GCM10027628 TaxID=3273413 RepID=UPI00363C28BD